MHVCPNNKNFIARRREKDGVCQDLWDHLEETSSLAGKFASKIGLEKHGELVGLLHDLGKASSVFDQYIKSATGLIDPDEDDYIDAKSNKGKIDHSSAGAQVVYRQFSDKGSEGLWIMQVLSLIIASHHSGLTDCLTPDGNDDFSRRMNKSDEKTRTKEAESNLDVKLKRKMEELLSNKNLNDFLKQKLISLRESCDSNETFMLKVGLLIRVLFSCLIDADRLSTADFEFPERANQRNQGNYAPWPVLIERLNHHLKKFESQTTNKTKNQEKVDAVRQDVSEYCLKFSNKPKGIYQLTVPTGGGKTFSSLRFALNHANKHNIPSFALEKREYGINIHEIKEHISRSCSEPWNYHSSDSAPMPGAIM